MTRYELLSLGHFGIVSYAFTAKRTHAWVSSEDLEHGLSKR